MELNRDSTESPNWSTMISIHSALEPWKGMHFGALDLQEVAVKQPSVGRQHHGVVRLMKHCEQEWPVLPERVHKRGASN